MLADTFAWVVGSVVAAELRLNSSQASSFSPATSSSDSPAQSYKSVSASSSDTTADDSAAALSMTSRSTCTNAAIASILGTILVLLAQPQSIPRPVAITCGAIAVAILLAARTIHRNLRERVIQSTTAATPVILFGAGDAGEQIASRHPS